MKLVIDKYLIKAIIKSYNEIGKTCYAIDRYLINVGSYPSCCEDSKNLYDDLIQQMIRKSKLIILKEIFLRYVKTLKTADREIFKFAIQTKITREEACFLLNISTRTLSRRVEQLYKKLASIMEKSKERQLVLDVCNNEYFIYSKYRLIKQESQACTKARLITKIKEGGYE